MEGIGKQQQEEAAALLKTDPTPTPLTATENCVLMATSSTSAPVMLNEMPDFTTHDDLYQMWYEPCNQNKIKLTTAIMAHTLE